MPRQAEAATYGNCTISLDINTNHMKKRVLIPLIGVGVIATPILYGIGDAVVHMAACKFGNQGACQELARRKDWSYEKDVKQPAQSKAAAKTEQKSDYANCLKLRQEMNELQAGLGDKSYDCDRVANWIPVPERARMADQQGLVRQCEATLKPALKDPNSYSYLSHGYVADGANGVKVTVKYTATNDFGGRVQGEKTCSYTL